MSNITTGFNIKTHIGLFDKEGKVQIDKVMDFMDISREELAGAFGLTGDQLRPEKIAPRTQEIMEELAGSIEYVADIFSGHEGKTRKWFNLPNVHFGGSTPKKIIINGRFRRVKSFIYASQKR